MPVPFDSETRAENAAVRSASRRHYDALVAARVLFEDALRLARGA